MCQTDQNINFSIVLIFKVHNSKLIYSFVHRKGLIYSIQMLIILMDYYRENYSLTIMWLLLLHELYNLSRKTNNFEVKPAHLCWETLIKRSHYLTKCNIFEKNARGKMARESRCFRGDDAVESSEKHTNTDWKMMREKLMIWWNRILTPWGWGG